MSLENRIIHGVLDKHEGFLRRHLVLSLAVIEKLRQRVIITTSTKDRMEKVSPDAQITLLIDILRRRGIRTLAKFLRILKESLDGWIADKILSTDLRVLNKYILTDDRTLTDFIIRVCGPPTPETKPEALIKHTREPIESRTKENNQAQRPQRQPRNENEDSLIYFLPTPPTHIAEVPGQVQHLHHVFEERRNQISSTLSVLKQEEQAIKDILEKNVSEQRHLNKNQEAIHEISRRLQSIHHEAGQLLKSAPNDVIVRKRLHHLHEVPWNSTKSRHKMI
ncbi:uncharacterized protein LOC133180426 [Saccostrea echinata]|uniref:uncharacterized protein LOC133180426 n=1 Tax=Saccostrea echinata TaxID=191078 RepID=UPI002A80E852|nr:uncharacterized protein LOC133180426 [Saccostrea echinata]